MIAGTFHCIFHSHSVYMDALCLILYSRYACLFPFKTEYLFIMDILSAQNNNNNVIEMITFSLVHFLSCVSSFDSMCIFVTPTATLHAVRWSLSVRATFTQQFLPTQFYFVAFSQSRRVRTLAALTHYWLQGTKDQIRIIIIIFAKLNANWNKDTRCGHSYPDIETRA